MGYDNEDIIFGLVMGIALFGLLITGILSFVDSYWVKPLVSQKANEYCKSEGFDFYESYERIGVLSKIPVAIKCKYVEQYRKIDLNSDKDLVLSYQNNGD